MENTQRVISEIHAHISNIAGVLPVSRLAKQDGVWHLEYSAPSGATVVIEAEGDSEYTQIRVRLVTEFDSTILSVSSSVAYSVGKALIGIVKG